MGGVNPYGKRVLLIVSTYLLNIDCIFCSSSSLISSDDLLLVVVSNLSVNNATSDTLPNSSNALILDASLFSVFNASF